MKTEKSHAAVNALMIGAVMSMAALAWASSVNAATANIWASASILPPIGMSQRSDMRFSGFVVGASPGTITVLVPAILPNALPTSATPINSGARLSAGGVKLVGERNCSAQLDCGVGALQIGGPPSGSFNGVSTSPTAILKSGDNTITLERIELRYGTDGSAGAVSGSGTLNPAGNGTIIIGGVLNVAAKQAVGTYSGPLIVLLDY